MGGVVRCCHSRVPFPALVSGVACALHMHRHALYINLRTVIMYLCADFKHSVIHLLTCHIAGYRCETRHRVVLVVLLGSVILYIHYNQWPLT